MSGTQDVVIAAGTESMTRVPMFSNMSLHAKAGIGEGPFAQSIQKRYGVAQFSQFTGAQMIADKYGFSCEDMDRFALQSHQRVAQAIEAGAFVDEIVPVETENGPFAQDEGVRFDASLEKIGSLDPLEEGGSITAANASQMTDGSLGVLVVNEKGFCCITSDRRKVMITCKYYATRTVFGVPICEKRLRIAARTLSSVI